MSYETILRIITIPVAAAWLVMIFAPRWRGTRTFIHSDVVQLGIAVVYIALIAPLLPGVLREFDTFEHISRAFTRPALVLAGWIHYLAFDLFVGRVVLGDAQRRGIHHLFVVPCLLLTFLLGPAGYLLYALVRFAHRQFMPVAPLPGPRPPTT